MDARLNDELDDIQLHDAKEGRWRSDARTILQFAGALLVGGCAPTVDEALKIAREAWFSLLADETLGQRAVSAPDSRAVAALRLPPSADRSTP